MKKIDKLDSYINRVIPYVMDDSESWYEFLAKVLAKVNEVVQSTNDFFDVDLKLYVEQKLIEWKETGQLTDIINNELFDHKLEKSVFDTHVTENNTKFNELETLIETKETGLDSKISGNTTLIQNLTISQEEMNTKIDESIKRYKETFYNVRDYGITENMTSDIGVLLQTLIDIVSSKGGGTIYLPNGTYLLDLNPDTASGVVLKDNVILMGQSKNTIIKAGTARYGNAVLYGNEVKNVQLINLTIDGNYTNTSNHSTMVRLRQCENCKIENVNFREVRGGAIILSYSKNSFVNHVNFYNILGEEHDKGVGGQCIYAQDLQGGVISNIIAENVGDHVLYLDTAENYLDRGGDYIINNLYAKNTGLNGVTNGAALNFCNAQEHFIVSNIILERVASGIRFAVNGSRNQNPKFFSLENVIIKSTLRGAGITLTSPSPNSRTYFIGSMKNIQIFSTSIDSDPLHTPVGMRITGVNNLLVEGLRIVSCASHGIIIEGGHMITIANGILSDNGIKITDGKGIIVGGGGRPTNTVKLINLDIPTGTFQTVSVHKPINEGSTYFRGLTGGQITGISGANYNIEESTTSTIP